jgi:hypothetical protein
MTVRNAYGDKTNRRFLQLLCDRLISLINAHLLKQGYQSQQRTDDRFSGRCRCDNTEHKKKKITPCMEKIYTDDSRAFSYKK